MGYKSIADIRRAWGDEWRDASDEEILGAYSKAAKLDVGQVADAFGYDPGKGSLARERIAGGIDNYQSGWWETGAAVAHGLGLDGVKQFAERKAADNRFQAEVAGARARQLGGIDSYEDVDGIGSGLNYFGGLAAQSLPFAVEALVGGWVGRGVGATAKGLQLASQAGRAADATQDVITAGRAAEAALGRRGMVGATVASYPSSVGDILGNQREQIEANGGEMNYGSAFAGGVPYSLLNGALGIEGALGRGQLARSGVRLLDDMKGVRGIAARTGASVGRKKAEEGTSELGQEFVNQYFGRMAVDPNETFYNDESDKRFRESFVGGAALGGAFGAVGGHRRSQDYYDRQRTPNPDQSTPREDWTTSQGFEDLLRQKDERQFDVPEWTTTRGFEGVRGLKIPTVDTQGLYADINETTPLNNVRLANELGVPNRPRVSNTVYGDNGIDFTPTRVYVAGNSDASGMGGIGGRPGQGAYMSDEDMMNDPGAVVARAAQEKARREQASLAAELKADDVRRAAERKDATDFGVDKKSQMEAIARLAAYLFPEATPGALFAHVAAQDRDASAYRQFMENLRLIKAGNVKSVLDWISATAENAKVQAEVSKAEIEAPINNLKAQAEAKNVSKRVPNVAQAPVDGGRGGAVDAGSQPAGGPGAVSGAVGAADTATGTPAPGATGVAVRAGGGDGGAVAVRKTDTEALADRLIGDLKLDENRTVMIGRKGREKPTTARQFIRALANAPEEDVRRVMAVTGRDMEGHAVSNPLSLDQVALLETKLNGGKPVSRQAVQQTLAKYGMSKEMVDLLVGHSVTSISESDLRGELDDNGVGNDNYRTAATLAGAAGATRIDAGQSQSEGKLLEGTAARRRQAEKTADEMLKAVEDKLAVDNAAVDEYLAGPKQEAVEVEANRQLAASNQQSEAAPRLMMEDGELQETEADDALRQRWAAEAEIRSAQRDWNNNLDEGDAAFEDIPADIQADFISNLRARNEGILPVRQFRELHYDLQQQANDAIRQFNYKTARVADGRGADLALEGPPGGRSGRDGASEGDRRSDAESGVGDNERDSAGTSGGSDRTKFSTDRAGSGSTVDEIYAEFAELGIRPNNRKVTVVQSVADVPQSMRKSVDNKSKVTASRVAAFVSGGRVWFIADNIAPGTGRAKFMHEVGSHLGIDRLLTEEQLDNLFSTIIKWADRNDGSMESNLARLAIARTGMAVTSDEDVQSEVIAYFIEEAVKAGIDPTAMSYKNELTRWFRTLYAAFKSAIRKLGWTNAVDKLTAQDIVDLAYGAAKLEMDGTFHGTAAQFRKFNHEFMGTGEGAQAYGWGSYLAQRPGIAKEYWEADVRRKAPKYADMADTLRERLHDAEKDLAEVERAADPKNEAELLAAVKGSRETLKTLQDALPARIVQLRGIVHDLKQELAEATRPAAEGSLMRVDVNVTDDELLDWDKPLSEQSEKVKKALAGNGLGADTFAKGQRGEQLYSYLTREHKSKKAASEYLDSIGIKGIKFLDAKSRGASRYEVKRGYKDGKDFWYAQVFGDNAGYHTDQSGKFNTEAEARSWGDGKLADRTNNIVVFNDKNIYRVASAVGADRSRMKFSVDAAVKTNDTSVDTYIRKVAGRSGVQLKTNLQHQAKKLVRSMAFLHDLVDEYKGAMPAVTDWYNAIQSTMARKRQLEADAELIAADAMKLKNGTDKVNAFIADATTSQKWWKDVERQKDGETVKVEADPELKNRFRQLEPEERKIVEAVFAHGDKMLEIKYQLLKDLGLDGVMLGTGKLPGPYAPLKRFGNYVTVLKSQALVDAEMAEDAAKAEELKKDPANYVVSFFDTLGQARMFAEDHSGKYAFTDYGEKQVRLGEELPAKHETLKRILDTIKVQNLPDEARVGMENLIREMYIQSLDEHHAATHGLTRKNTAGYETDMLRSFLSHARAEANFLAHLEYGGKVNNAFYEMQRQSRDRPGGKVVHRDALATLTRHYAENLNYKETPIQDRLMAFTSAWQLATSLGYHVANATQPVMTTVPKLASDFNDYAGAWKAVMDGYQTVKKTGVWGNIELDKVSDGGLRKALQRAADLGVLDVGMDEDLTHFEQTRTGFGVVDKASKVAKTALHNLRKVSRAVETANRVAAATAAYNMAKKHGMAEQAAQDYAVRMLETTQGDFSRTGAPLLLKKLPKIMTQYKKFQFMMMALYAKAFVQVFHGVDLVKLTKDNSPEAKQIRAIGRRMLAFKLFHTSMAAGALGLPMMNLAGPVLARMLAGDEEPPDLERDLRKIIGDETMADMLLHGPLHFMGMDAKLGEEKIFSILPYADWDFSSASGALKTAAGLAGPAMSLGLRFAAGVEAFEKGDIYKGVEKFMPSGAANALKAFRIANEGYTLKNGDVMFAPDDINGAALAFDFFGLPSSDMKRMDWLRGQQYELTQFYKDRTKAIAKQYTDAVKDGDMDQASDAREAWMELQASKDRLRYLFGDSADELKRQPLSALMKYPKNQAEREQRLQRAAVVP